MKRPLAIFFPALLISVIALSRSASGQLQDGGSDRDVTSAQYEQWKVNCLTGDVGGTTTRSGP